jgi:hypothetical protein
MTPRALSVCLIALATLACGSRQLGANDGASSTDSSTSDSSSAEATTAPETTTGNESETTGATETGVDFVPPSPDVPPSCDPFVNDCPVGEKCVPYSTSGGPFDGNKCVPILGDGQPGDPCTYGGTTEATDDCGADSYCWDAEDVDGALVGTCYAFCTGSADDPMCPEGFICPITGDGTIVLCFPICDPLAQDCDEGLGCYWVGYEFLCSPQTANHETGQPCGYVNDCAPGNTCVDTTDLPACDDFACCAPFCDLSLPDDCDALLPGTSCTPFFEQPTPPNQDLGVCLAP